MRLVADSVDRNPFGLQTLDQIMQKLPFHGIIRVVIVDEQLGVRIGLMRKKERLFNKFFACNLIP